MRLPSIVVAALLGALSAAAPSPCGAQQAGPSFAGHWSGSIRLPTTELP